MDHTPLDQGMFLAGAFMALTPMVGTLIVLFVWWRRKKQERETQERAQGASTSGRVS